MGCDSEAFCDRIYKPAIKFHINGPSLREAQVKITTQPTAPQSLPSDLPSVNEQSPISPSEVTKVTIKRKRGRPRKSELTTENIESLSDSGNNGKNGNNGSLPLSGNNGNLPKLPKEGA